MLNSDEFAGDYNSDEFAGKVRKPRITASMFNSDEFAGDYNLDEFAGKHAAQCSKFESRESPRVCSTQMSSRQACCTTFTVHAAQQCGRS
jgi:hypothetical protein